MYISGEITQIVFLALVFFFSGFVAYLNYRLNMHLIEKGEYKKLYRKSSDIKFGMILLTIGVATGVSLIITGRFYTPANLGFFIPAFTGLTLIIMSFIEEEEEGNKKKK